MLFKRHLIEKILSGEKTRTIRRTGKYKVGKIYSVLDRPGGRVWAKVLIVGKKPKKLGELTTEDVIPDGFRTLADFREEWINIYGSFSPDEIVWLYDFLVVEPRPPGPRSWPTSSRATRGPSRTRR